MKEIIVSACEKEADRTNQPATVASLIPQRFKGRKRWQIAQSRSKDGAQQNLNRVTEGHYQMMLRIIKPLLANSGQVIFERNYKGDATDSYLSMHAFLSPSCYLYLECELQYDYVISYAFDNCQHEQALLKLLKPIIALGRAKSVELKPDYAIFYKNVLAFQQQHFIHTL